MKLYLNETVFEAALGRIRWLFDEFEHVYVNCSGGKDSTVVLNLALMVAEEKGRLPLPVVFIDQEAEWKATIDYIRQVMSDPRVDPYWLQVPIRLFNATSTNDPWLHCWEPGAQWIRDKEPDSIHENVFGTDRFAEMFNAFVQHRHPGERTCNIAGVRCEESPSRFMGLTTYATYKGETWGKVENKRYGQYTFYPIYDWSYTDVWKAIHDNGWPYCRLYDYYYQYGVPVQQMRVSNVHHETAVKNLFFLKELEPETWEAITARLSGINTVRHLRADFFAPTELPWMFESWEEYRDYLLENLIEDEEHKAWFRRTFAAYDSRYEGKAKQALLKTEIAMILVNDYHGTKLTTFVASHAAQSKGAGKRNGRYGQ